MNEEDTSDLDVLSHSSVQTEQKPAIRGQKLHGTDAYSLRIVHYRWR